MKNRRRVGASPETRKARNSKKEGVSYDANIWEDIVTYFTKKHGINEYDFNRIICLSFPAWGRRKHINSTYKKSREYQLSLDKQDKWCYPISSKDILDSLMAWPRFVKLMDKAIRYLKPKMGNFNELWSAIRMGLTPKKDLEGETGIQDTSEWSEEFWKTETENINNILYGEYNEK